MSSVTPKVFIPFYSYFEAPRGFGEQGKQGIYFRGTGEQRLILRGTGEQRQYWGTGNIRKHIFDFWGTGEQANLFQGNKGTGTPPGRASTLYNDCSHIEDVHLLFCANFMFFFSFLRGVELRHFSSKMPRGSLVCVISNS